MKKQGKPTEKRIEHVAAYLRISKEETDEQGLGLGAQQTKVLAQAVVKGWLSPVCLYIDDDVTGTIDLSEREAGSMLLADIEAGKIDAVIVSALDRLGRKAVYILNFVEKINENVQLVSCKETIDTTTATGKFVLRMFASLAELERDTISERTVAALEQRGRTVGIKTGLPPYGYRYNGKDVTVHALEAEVVRQVYELRGQGLSLRAIALQVPLSFNAVKNVLDREAVYRGGKRGESDNFWPKILV